MKGDIRRRTALGVAGMVMLALALLPTPSAHALTPLTESARPTSSSRATRLERVWLRQQIRHERLGVLFNHAQQRIDLAQKMIDQAKANGKDVTALQGALDAFSGAVQQARPTYEGMQGIISSHKGFDANGTVIDSTVALGTVRDMQTKFRVIRDTLSAPAQDLRDAVRAFRQVNQPTS